MNEARSCCGAAKMNHQPDDLADNHLQLFGAEFLGESSQIEELPAQLGKLFCKMLFNCVSPVGMTKHLSHQSV